MICPQAVQQLSRTSEVRPVRESDLEVPDRVILSARYVGERNSEIDMSLRTIRLELQCAFQMIDRFLLTSGYVEQHRSQMVMGSKVIGLDP